MNVKLTDKTDSNKNQKEVINYGNATGSFD